MPSNPETLLIYGETFAGKTAQLGKLAEWEYNRTGRISRLISADSNWDPCKDLVMTADNPKGIIQAFRATALKDPWSKLVKMTEGCWPSLKILPDGKWNLIFEPPKIKNDRILISGTEPWIPADDTREVGQYFWEGLTTIAKLCLQDHADHADTRQMWGTGKEGATTFDTEVLVLKPGKTVPEVEKTKIGRAVGGHYGSVQGWMTGVLIARLAEFRLVDRVVWTSHVGRGKDDVTGMAAKVLGPNTVGQASVDELPQKFGHTLHMESETLFDQAGNVRPVYRAWFVKHKDSVLTGMDWPAKISLTMDQGAQLLKQFPKGYIDLSGGKSLGQYLDFLHPPTPTTKGGGK